MSEIIAVRELSKKFGEFTAVDSISFSVKRGTTFAFLGPNGAGKTTTIKMLTTLLTPSSGVATLDGHDVAKEPNEARKSFGIVFQDPSLDEELTAFENMDLHGMLYSIGPKVARHERIKEMLEFVDLYERRDDLVKHFSGGMKRRLEIARGLLHKPKILFLDEPTIGLDPQTRNHIWNYVKKLNREGTTVFFTTHYMDEAEKAADEIAVIDHGKIVVIGTAKQLKKQTGKKSLEDAFIALTGHKIREDTPGATDTMRRLSRVWGRR